MDLVGNSAYAMKNELSKQQLDEIMKAFNDAIEKGPWDESSFLRVIGKNLREIRDKFSEQLNASDQETSKIASQLANRMALRSGQKEIFILLYSSDGSNMQSWERIVINLPRQMISRPVYANEEDLKALLKTKENKVNEAYISVYVNQGDLLSIPADKAPLDKLGKSLLTLKDNVIRLDNVNRFVHLSGTYDYVQGRLVKNMAIESD